MARQTTITTHTGCGPLVSAAAPRPTRPSLALLKKKPLCVVLQDNMLDDTPFANGAITPQSIQSVPVEMQCDDNNQTDIQVAQLPSPASIDDLTSSSADDSTLLGSLPPIAPVSLKATATVATTATATATVPTSTTNHVAKPVWSCYSRTTLLPDVADLSLMKLMLTAGSILKLSARTIALALCYFQEYAAETDVMRTIAPVAALNLACSLQQPRSLRQVLTCFWYAKYHKLLNIDDEFWDMKESAAACQFHMVRVLEFDLERKTPLHFNLDDNPGLDMLLLAVMVSPKLSFDPEGTFHRGKALLSRLANTPSETSTFFLMDDDFADDEFLTVLNYAVPQHC